MCIVLFLPCAYAYRRRYKHMCVCVYIYVYHIICLCMYHLDTYIHAWKHSLNVCMCART